MVAAGERGCGIATKCSKQQQRVARAVQLVVRDEARLRAQGLQCAGAASRSRPEPQAARGGRGAARGTERDVRMLQCSTVA